MKELEKHNLDSQKESIEIIQQKKKETEYQYKGSERPLKGHKVFEINTKTLKVNLAEELKEEVIYWFDAIRDIENGVTKKVHIKKDCVYISAASKNAALKRYKENKGSAIMANGFMEL